MNWLRTHTPTAVLICGVTLLASWVFSQVVGLAAWCVAYGFHHPGGSLIWLTIICIVAVWFVREWLIGFASKIGHGQPSEPEKAEK